MEDVGKLGIESIGFDATPTGPDIAAFFMEVRLEHEVLLMGMVEGDDEFVPILLEAVLEEGLVLFLLRDRIVECQRFFTALSVRP